MRKRNIAYAMANREYRRIEEEVQVNDTPLWFFVMFDISNKGLAES